MEQQSLIQRQEAAIARMQEPRTSEKREARHRRAVAADFIEAAMRAGYTLAEAKQQWQDTRDVYSLRQNAEEHA